MMYNYRNPPPSPTPEEQYHKGQAIGLFDIDILSEQDGWKICTYWGGFRKSDFEKFPNHPLLEILKKIYSTLEPNQIIKKPRFREFFEDNPDYSLIHKIQSKKKYPKGTKFVAYLQLETILRPYDFEKGELFFEYRDYDFPNGMPKAQMNKVLYGLLIDLHSALKYTKR